MELPEGWSLKKSRLGQKAFIHSETNTKIFEVPDENTIFELASARPKKYKAFLDRIAGQKGPEKDIKQPEPLVDVEKSEELTMKNEEVEIEKPPVVAGNGEFFLAFIKKN
ncbi:Oidioi.mRNA.OKI2018_I69.chr2.g6982.t1.cds [Oikopleura dioica]|uniref:Oidioi.mRNA.OKI2018_I69.chr2.g6982.t1.cds n=1 Tax=Oikopleura dioica TaxID=34765 RepID=A0ABN7TBR1_OIKDI|nr:Oidioi.mRNA.OKI2018_I69.chr2.g6982.t1.cds [Oikopleura dioica]